jgi:hypothetical protein
MSQIIIELDEFTSEITPGELMILKCIYTGNKRGFETFSKTYSTFVSAILESLQNKLYLKIQGDEFEELVCREKTEVLFGSKDSTFEEFWDKYHIICKLPKTDLKPSKLKWNRLTKGKKKKAIDNIKAYWDSLNDKRYCKKARTYLEDESFENQFSNYQAVRVIAR